MLGCTAILACLAGCKVELARELFRGIVPHQQTAVVADALLAKEGALANFRKGCGHECLSVSGLNPDRSQRRHSGTLR